MRLHERSISKVTLINVLKRRKSSLKRFLEETGIVTYELLRTRCDSMGVIPPEEQEFLDTTGTYAEGTATVSSPAEGVIVLNPPKVINELTGLQIAMPDIETDVSTEAVVSQEAVLSEIETDESLAKKKKKKP